MRLWFFYYVYDADWEGYTAVPESHVRWFEELADEMPQTQSLAFVHVPLPEVFNAAYNGDHFENMRYSKQNYGLYDAMVRNGVVAVAAGHEHINDYCGTTVDSLHFCYAGSAG